jgi:hypothetical protein
MAIAVAFGAVDERLDAQTVGHIPVRLVGAGYCGVAGTANLPEPMPAHMDWGTDFAAWTNKVERPFRED